MNNQDKHNFKKLFDDMADYYGKAQLSQDVLKIYFAGLEHFSFEQIQQAANAHIQASEFMPKVADFVKRLGGGEITADGIIAAAKLKNTPLGILCRIQIGTLSLNSGDAFHLKQRAEECLQLLPEWKARALAGEYTDHELSIMVKHDVDPCQPFTIGLSKPVSVPALRSRLEAIKDTPRHKFLLERPYDGDNDKTIKQAKNVSDYIAIEMMKGEKE